MSRSISLTAEARAKRTPSRRHLDSLQFDGPASTTRDSLLTLHLFAQCQRVSCSPSHGSRTPAHSASFPRRFWQHTISTAEQSEEDFKHQALPLARIKKVMKSDPEVRVRPIREEPLMRALGDQTKADHAT